MEPSRFDDLTKVLATSTSRRQALRRIGGILGGTALAGLFPGLAFASNSACTTFCNAVFGAETQAAGKCISDAAHHKGLCYTCGPAAPAGHPPVCGQVCCSSGQTCQSGTCCTPTTCAARGVSCGTISNGCGGTLNCGTCSSGQTCTNGQCVAICPSLPACNDTCPCPTGQTCTNGQCCGANGGTCRNGGDCCSLRCDNTTGTCVSCLPTGHAFCNIGPDCCSGLCHGLTGTCVSCLPTGDVGCGGGEDCCSGLCDESTGTCG